MTARAAPRRSLPRLPPRPVVRGKPADTRDRLVAAAARELERHGYHGTDSNQIAHAAGYSPGTFYKHFKDKREALLAAHEAWVSAEWDALDAITGDPATRAGAIVDFVIEHHRRWRGLRASLRTLVATDPVVRRFHWAQRLRQLARMGVGPGVPAARRANATLLLLEVERIADAIATGELEALGVAPSVGRRHMVGRVLAYLEGIR
jgi:AcrR family transcriptional regulator